MRSVSMAVLALAVAASLAFAQQPRVAAAPDSVTVGEIFRVAVRLTVPRAERVLFPDTLDVPDHVEAAARLDLVTDTTADGDRRFTAIWALAAWRPGRIGLPPLRYRVVTPDAERTLQAELPTVVVHSVLPQDTADVEPMPARDVVGPDRLLWPLLLLTALAALLVAVGVWAWRRWRRASAPVPVQLPALPPRVAALLALERLLQARWLERGEVKMFLFALTALVRRYLADLDPGWSTDLTTSELARAVHASVGAAAWSRAGTGDVSPAKLGAFLARADLVKFARATATPDEARADLDMVRQWIESFVWPPPVTEERAA